MELKEIRNKNNLTQLDASNILGVPLRTYVRYENDNKYQDTFKYRKMVETLKEYTRIAEDKGILSVETIKIIIKEVLDKYNVEYCYLFGSYAKLNATETSDVDLLIATNVTGMQFFGLVEDLRNALHKNVDLIRVVDLKGNIELLNEILKDGLKIYG